MTLIKKPAQLEIQSTIKTLIYGQPGMGKTTLSLSAPKPLLLDFDGGVHRVNPIHQVDTVQIRSWDDMIALLKEDLSAYETIVHDTAGRMLDFMSAYLIKNDPKLAMKDGSLQLKGYGARKVMFQNYLAQLSMMGKHLVFVAHDREERDGDTKFIRPEIGGSSGGDLIKGIDLVGYMEANGKKRTISFDPCEKFYGKNTCSLPALIELPDVVAGGKPNLLLSEIFAKYQASLEDRKRIMANYDELVQMMKDTIASDVVDADSLNKFVAWAKGLQHIWDSKMQAIAMIKAKAEQLNLILNPEKIYVSKNPAPAPVQNGNPPAAAPTPDAAPPAQAPAKEEAQPIAQDSAPGTGVLL